MSFKFRERKKFSWRTLSTLRGSFYFISFSNVIIPFICASDLQIKLSYQRVIIRPFILLHLKNCILFPFQLICWRGHNNIRAKEEIKSRKNQLGETKKRCYKMPLNKFFPRQSSARQAKIFPLNLKTTHAYFASKVKSFTRSFSRLISSS